MALVSRALTVDDHNEQAAVACPSGSVVSVSRLFFSHIVRFVLLFLKRFLDNSAPGFSQLGCFLLLNSSLRSNLDEVFSCFLGKLQILFCCHASMTFSISVLRHRSNFFLRDIVLFVHLGLQLALLFLFF